MNIIAIIPARGGSKRLPDKNILPVAGKPMIAWTIEAALRSHLLTKVAVSTDDKNIAAVARQFGAEVIDRPKELAADTSPMGEALCHAVETLQKDGFKPDIVVCMQANVPVRQLGVTDMVIRKLVSSPKVTAVATAQRVLHHPEWMKRLPKTYIKPYMPDVKSYRTQDLEELYYLDGAVIAVRAKSLLRAGKKGEPHDYMGDRVLIVPQERIYGIEIDEADEMFIAQAVMEKLHCNLQACEPPKGQTASGKQ